MLSLAETGLCSLFICALTCSLVGDEVFGAGGFFCAQGLNFLLLKVFKSFHFHIFLSLDSTLTLTSRCIDTVISISYYYVKLFLAFLCHVDVLSPGEIQRAWSRAEITRLTPVKTRDCEVLHMPDADCGTR